MTRREDKARLADVKALAGRGWRLLCPLVQVVLQEMLGAEMTEARSRAGRADADASWLVSGDFKHPGHPGRRAGSPVPQDRHGRFSTELFERYQRSELERALEVLRDEA